MKTSINIKLKRFLWLFSGSVLSFTLPICSHYAGSILPICKPIQCTGCFCPIKEKDFFSFALKEQKFFKPALQEQCVNCIKLNRCNRNRKFLKPFF